MKLTTYVAPAVAALVIASPAQSNDNLSANEKELYWYAYAYGMVVDNCITTTRETSAKTTSSSNLENHRSLEDVTPYSKTAIHEESIIESARKNEMFRACLPIVNGVWDQDDKVQSTVQTADLLEGESI